MLATDSTAAVGAGERTFKESIAVAAYEEAGIGPDDVDVAEVYDLSTALELDWIEDLGLCKPGEAEALLRAGDTTIGGRIPVNPSGGLACFGEAVPAQALAQVCELTWQLRGQATGRQVEGARVGITANQGLFGHGSSVRPDPLSPGSVAGVIPPPPRCSTSSPCPDAVEPVPGGPGAASGPATWCSPRAATRTSRPG